MTTDAKASETTNGVTLRRATRPDAPALLELIAALAQFEKLAGPDAAARERLIEHGFGERPRFEAWLAFPEDRPDPVGYAVFFEMYSTFRASPILYLEDLFVLPEFRHRGIGSALLRHCIQLAHNRGCSSMEWTCLDWNTHAQNVYERIGACRLSEWYLYRLTRDDMAKFLLARSPPAATAEPRTKHHESPITDHAPRTTPP
jgi:GNAT superfamily N-acetyltransferase